MQNQKFQTVCGQEIWKSRNVATSVCVIRTNPDDTAKIQVLAVKRGKDVSNSGLYCFPCGYLDWDENIKEAAARELLEEANLSVSPETLEFYQIDSCPKKDLQNVTIHFYFYTEKDVESYKPKDFGEVEEIIWVDVDRVQELEWAFDHLERISGLVNNQPPIKG